MAGSASPAVRGWRSGGGAGLASHWALSVEPAEPPKKSTKGLTPSYATAGSLAKRVADYYTRLGRLGLQGIS
jgi:hypothetical protein